MTPIEKIRAEMPLEKAWRILNLHGEPIVNRDLRSPFREDTRPSFRIYPGKDHLRWYDHGNQAGGDVIDLWAAASGMSNTDAIAEILRYLGGAGIGGPRKGYTMSGGPVRMAEEPPPPPPTTYRAPPDLRDATTDECYTLAALRGLLPGAFDLASYLGTLKVATIYGQKSWLITDPTGICAEARRFDGENYQVNGEPRKGFCLGGSKKDWLLGLVTRRPEWDAVENILMVEGQPDYFAALSLAIDCPINFRVVAALGANIPLLREECRPLLVGKKIVIVPHNDPAGQVALVKWVKDLYRLGAKKVITQQLPIMHDDLNGFLQNPGPLNPADLLKGFADVHRDARPTGE